MSYEVAGFGVLRMSEHARERMAQRGIVDLDVVAALEADSRKTTAVTVLANEHPIEVTLGGLVFVLRRVAPGTLLVVTIRRRGQ